MKKTFLISILSLFPIIAFSQAKWQATLGTVMFKIKNTGATVTGRFSGLKANLIFSPDKLAASALKGSVDVSTLKTGIDKRDKDLMGEKYFDAGKHQQIEVASVKLTKKGSGYSGQFNVTIKGVTKPVEIPFSFTQTGNQAEFKGDFSVNRRDFGLGEKSVMMSDDVNVSIDVKAKSGK